jgi:hypothetical protein
VFRDSRGVVHTVSSADPLDDLPVDAAEALQRALLEPGDLGTLLERCDAVLELLDDWQTAFFQGLPSEWDRDEEARAAEEAGLSLEQVEAECAVDDLLDDGPDGFPDAFDAFDQEELDLGDLEDLVLPPDDDPRHRIPEALLSDLERSLLLLPMRVRLEALIAAEQLVDDWQQLLSDHEKLVGHLVLAHDGLDAVGDLDDHEGLADHHARLHVATGPGHAATAAPPDRYAGEVEGA